ncbi:MAG TPA: CHASE2 domain-containing protein [Thermoanaerobaculia bacterium]|nr:CHASE2 domain-containing protein [Thermoanaerobaculia bacterium]
MWTRLKEIYKSREKAYWRVAGVAIGLGVVLGVWLDARDVGMSVRYRIQQVALRRLLPTRAEPRWTTLVLIDDSEYWKGSLARRSPIRRDYLATLLRTVSRCDPWVMAIDFDLRSPVLDGTLPDNPAYQLETKKLVEAVRDVSKDHPIVLPVTISETAVEPSVLDEIPDDPGQVARGNISLPFDYRQIPTSEFLSHRVAVDSFALATAGLVNPTVLKRFPPDEDFPFAEEFIAPQAFPTILYREDPSFPSARECRNLRHKVVIVGATWHTKGFNRGPLVDARDYTPMGYAVGAVYLHANYIEALLESKTYPSLGTIPSLIVEILASILVAVILAAKSPELLLGVKSAAVLQRLTAPVPSWVRVLMAQLAAAAVTAFLLLLLTYVFAQNFGLYSDFFIPVVFLFIHALWNYWNELRKAAELSSLRSLGVGTP